MKLNVKKIENIAFDNRKVTLTNDNHTVVITHHDCADEIEVAEGDSVELHIGEAKAPKVAKAPAAPKAAKKAK